MQTLKSIHDILSRISFPNFKFIIKSNNGPFNLDRGLYLQILCEDKCNVNGDSYEWKSRKWALSTHMTDGELVQTAFKAVMTAI